MDEDILHLRHIRVRPGQGQVAIDGGHYHIKAESLTEPVGCPQCGSQNIRRHSVYERMVRDLPIHAKQVGLYLTRQRWRCQDCGKTFFAENPDLDPKRDMTARLCLWIKEQSIRRPFAHVAEETGMAESAIRQIFADYCNELESKVRIEAPEYLGIDEIHLIRKPRCVIGNIRERTIVDILPTRNKDAVIHYLANLEGRQRIRYAAINMWAPYRDALQSVTPKAVIAVDKFHVLRLASNALEAVRKRHREIIPPKMKRRLVKDRFVLLSRPERLSDQQQLTLSGWLENFPMLKAGYEAKEGFYRLYDCETRADAERYYAAWKKGLDESIAWAYADVVRAVDNWGPWIFTYFDHRITNAFSESINNLIRLLSRLGRGYSFEALRAKILYTDHIHKTKQPRLRREPEAFKHYTAFLATDTFSRMPPATFDDDRVIDYGVDISLLAELLEFGDF